MTGKFWRAAVENKSLDERRTLKSLIITQRGKAMVVRMTFTDETFSDFECESMPRFHLGESFSLRMFDTVDVTTTAGETLAEAQR